MARNAPGKHWRKGMTLMEVTRMFPDDATAEQWFVETRWSDGVACPHCGSVNVREVTNRKPMPYRCRDCRKHFSVKTGTVMQSSNLGLQIWALAFYLLSTGLKGTSSMKLHRDLGVTQKTAWHLAHRIRETWQDGDQGGNFEGAVEVDEGYFGGKSKNKHAWKRKLEEGKDTKAAVIGMKERGTGRVRAKVIEKADGNTLKGFVRENVKDGTKVYTDAAPAYNGVANRKYVSHSVGQYVDGMAHTNGMESFWSMMKRGYHGTYHKMSPKHLDRYVGEFEGRHNQRPLDTIEQMQVMVVRAEDKRLRYKDLTRKNGLSSGARPLKVVV